ncbi:hypothetical protein QTP86_001690 [Hemibagrus guttatus]|nr:hypothetical protein QTP86_001690 [Hemibagrus guttatus]
MQRGGDKTPAPVVRLRHSVRVQLQSDAPEDVRRRFGWDWVVLRLLRDLCKIQASKIFCLQDFTSAGFLDVTFSAFSDCSSFFDQCSRLPEEESLRGLRLVPLFAMDEVPVTVHLYNPFVADEDIRAFLGRYCSSVAAGERIRGRFGIWNGKRRFLARLKVDPSSPGGLLHPPGSFTIGPHRGYLHYPGQPLYCRRCGALGHTKERCMGRRCRSCGAEGHSAADCGAPKTCSLCGSEEHLYRYCPARKKTFASLFTEDPEEVGAHSGGQQVGAGPAQRGAEPQGAVRVAELAAEPPGQPDQEQRAAEDTRDPPQEAEASEVGGGAPGRGPSIRSCYLRLAFFGAGVGAGAQHPAECLDSHVLGRRVGGPGGDARASSARLVLHGVLRHSGAGGLTPGIGGGGRQARRGANQTG